MSKIALTADWHARGKDLDAFERQLAALVDDCNARGVDLLCVAGDIFDNSAIQDPHASTGAIARAILAQMRRLENTDLLMIPGNHDCAGSGSADALNIFGENRRAKIVRTPKWMVYDRHGFAAYCVPWDWSGAAFPAKDAMFSPEYEAILANKQKTLLLAHVQVAGATMNGVNGGLACPEGTGKFQISRADLAALPFDHVALGDFHKRQDLTDGRGGYIGALRQCNFGEEGNPAGFEIWDTETGAVEWLELDAAPRHRTFYVKAGEQPNLPAPSPDWRFKVRLTGGQHDPTLARDLERDGHTVEIIPELDERVERAAVPPNVINEPKALMAVWTEANGISDERLNEMMRAWDDLEPDENEGEVKNDSA